MSCLALQLSPHKPKRSRFSQKHRSEGVRLAEALRAFEREFPRFANHLSDCVQRITADAERTRASDREKVLKALREWQYGLTAKELMEDTGLSHWDVRQTVYQLKKSGTVIETRELRAGIHSKQWCTTYQLKGTQ